ncbi:MAG: hypothetical protein OHK0023_10980 [Anaerolineae bacterium]
MELRMLWGVITRRWWLIALPTVVAAVLSLPVLGSVLSPSIQYRVVLRFTAAQPPQDTPSFEESSYISWLGSEYAIINLAAWLRTESFARETAQILKAKNQNINEEALRSAIAADSVRSILTMYLTWDDPNQLEAIASAASEALRLKSGDYFPQLAQQPARIVALDDVIITPLGAGLTDRIAPLLRLLIGLAAGIGLAFLAEYLDPTLRSRHELEGLGIQVLAEIPRR